MLAHRWLQARAFVDLLLKGEGSGRGGPRGEDRTDGQRGGDIEGSVVGQGWGQGRGLLLKELLKVSCVYSDLLLLIFFIG